MSDPTPHRPDAEEPESSVPPPAPEPEPQTELQPESQPEPQPEPQPESLRESQPEPDTEPLAEPQPQPQPQPQPAPDAGAPPQTEYQQPAYQPWAARFGLVRPRHGRYIAGVCASIGRATNTDPLLWRVIIGVLAVFGIGIFLYLAAWLLTPAEGDTASPLEALFGRGFSTTSTGVTIVLAVIAVVLIGGLTNSFLLAVAAGAGLVVAAIAANPRNQRPAPAQMVTTVPASAPQQPTYIPPFAPHGPYAGPPPPPPPPVVSAPRPKREPSRLGRLIFGIALLALGMLGIADLAGVPVPGVFYVAAALAIVGVGLVVGAWFGRARGYIAIGIILSLLLPIVSDEGHRDRTVRPGSVSWTPLTAAEISDSYNHRFGDATLDLSNVDFNGHDVDIDVGISFGELRVIVPDKVDVTVDSDVNLGDAQVFGQDSSGAGVEQTFRDDGADGAGGGSLHIRLHVSFAHAEVDR